MNGEVNGTIDKPMDTTDSNAPEGLHDLKITSQSNDDTSDTFENTKNEDSIHLANQSSMDSKLPSSNEEESNDDNSNASETDSHIANNMPDNDDSNNIDLDNHCSNSRDSDGESMISSQAKSETTEHPNSLDDQSKDGQSDKQFEKNVETNENTENEIDSEDDSSEEVFNARPRAEDTVSINSDSDPEEVDDSSMDSQKRNKSNDVLILEKERSRSQNGNNHDSPSPEVHEIVSDNEESTVSINNTNKSENKVQLRRSNRAIKRKKYNDEAINGCDGSDIEEVSVESNFNRKGKAIVINDTRTLVEMAAKQMTNHFSNNAQKKPTVVIIDSKSSTSDRSPTIAKPLPTSTNVSAESLYQSIVARGTTVTPVKSNASTQISSQTSQPPILPSLTDDMFVVEAPSFIVPYVYEKPSLKPFREFVDILGKELDEQKAKEEKENQEKLKKEKIEKMLKNVKEKGDVVSDDKVSADSVEDTKQDTKLGSEDCDSTKDKSVSAKPSEESEEKMKKKKEKRRRRKNDDDDASWDGESSEDSDDELLSDEEKTIIIKEKVDSIDEIKDVTELTADKVCINKSDNYFDCSLGKFFINIGLSLVQEFVQTDLLKQQNRKLYREKKTGQNTKATETSIASLIKNIEFSKENNAPYSFPQNKCEFCTFKSESNLVMKHHLETPHMKNNVYKCNYCSFEIRSPHDILFHMEAEHNVRGKLERAPAYHQCANCTFEDNGKGKLARHLIPCAKKFKPEMNLAPPLEWEPPAKIPKITKARNSLMGSYQTTFNKNQIGTPIARPPGLHVSSMMTSVGAYRPRGRSPMAMPPRSAPVHGTPIIRGGVMVRHNAHGLMSTNYPVANNVKQKSGHQPSISITPLPRQPHPQVLPQPAHNTKSTFVICEICDGYIKDLEQLRNHMQWIHKVKIHPKMIYNRPPLNCQKCQFRFFTDQGLERHLLGSHGLVTSSMQEAANKGKDAGRCPVCGRVYQWKLLNHVARDHNMTLKPAHLSYKCTVCTATFGMYKQFENHVYSAHSVVAKRVMDKSKSIAPATKGQSESLLKPLKINDEITIIPQPVKAAAAKDE